MRLSLVLAVFVAGNLAQAAQAPNYQCWNFGQQDEIRRDYLVEVNKLRETIATGTAPSKDGRKCPQGKNIYKLNWDCILENYAQKAADECAEPKTVPKKLSFVYNATTLTTCNPIPDIKKQVNNWWSEVERVGLAKNAAFKPKLRNFAVLANGLATRIGCAQKNCNGVLHMVCVVYGKAASSTRQAIYEVGAGCEGNYQCTTYKESKCLTKRKLCEAGYPTSEAVVPPTVSTSKPTITSTEATQPEPQPPKPEPPKPEPPKPETTKPPVTSEHCPKQEHMNTDLAREEFVNLHNQARATIAKGGVKMGDGKMSRPCPRMKKFDIKNYDCKLEEVAYATAAKCQTEVYVQNENWFMASTKATNRKLAAREAVEHWYNEIKSGHMEQKTGSQNLLMPSFKIDHFARMVWDTNTQIGCAAHKCGKIYHVVCRYGPKVGKYGDTIYMMGPTCNQCQGRCIEGAFCP
ncbi:SCP-like protein [Ancylostoma caninum]|uniref:SCP-like protein n=1 Tax=Ancylostoma caninum TaxID=29170 RepID=A0A368GR96_ANCCA|nr:SCP-like protein [Ancylostoma caninum]